VFYIFENRTITHWEMTQWGHLMTPLLVFSPHDLWELQRTANTNQPGQTWSPDLCHFGPGSQLSSEPKGAGHCPLQASFTVDLVTQVFILVVQQNICFLHSIGPDPGNSQAGQTCPKPGLRPLLQICNTIGRSWKFLLALNPQTFPHLLKPALSPE
jgi:hypothetical protein